MFEQGAIINDRYLLERELGKGGFSMVWLATDQYTQTEVAIKIYAPDKGLDKVGLQQFQKEYVRTRGIKHPHLLVPEHFDIISSTNSPFLVIPYCPKGSIYEVLHEQGVLSEQDLANLIHQVGGGLKHLHNQGVIHQDIKPDNILIDNRDQYQLTDFGISRKMRSTLNKATANQSYMTLSYSPPERYSANPMDTPASDIFSLGVMIYELCTSSTPWDGAGGMVLNSGAAVPHLPESYSKRFNEWIRACMQKDHTLRPTAEELMKAAATFLSEGSWPKWEASEEAPVKEEPAPSRKTQQIDRVALEQPVAGSESGQQTMADANAAGGKKTAKQKKGSSGKVVFAVLGVVLVVVSVGAIMYFNQSTPFDQKMDAVEASINAGDYFQAREDLMVAMTMEGDSTLVAQQMELVDGYIYDSLIGDGDVYYDDEDYEAAIASFNQALEYRAGDSYATERINDSQNALANARGDAHFNAQEYQSAIADYRQALQYKSGDSYAQNRIRESQNALNRIEANEEEQRLARLYADYISRGDAHFTAAQYEEAITDYRQALRYRPGDSYALSQISKSEELKPFVYTTDFSSEPSEFQNFSDENKVWVTEVGYLKGFSYNDSYSYSKSHYHDEMDGAKTFEYSVSVRYVEGSQNHDIGIMFSSDGADPSQRFSVDGDASHYYVGVYQGGEWNGEWYEMTAGRSGWNTLKVMYNGFQFVYYVNGTEVHRKQAQIFGNRYGVYMDGDVTQAWFDNMRLEATF